MCRRCTAERGGEGGAERRRRIHNPRDAEVCQLGDDFRAQQGKQDVGRLDVQMHQAGQVQREETVGDAAQDVQVLHSREGW